MVKVCPASKVSLSSFNGGISIPSAETSDAFVAVIGWLNRTQFFASAYSAALACLPNQNNCNHSSQPCVCAPFNSGRDTCTSRSNWARVGVDRQLPHDCEVPFKIKKQLKRNKRKDVLIATILKALQTQPCGFALYLPEFCCRRQVWFLPCHRFPCGKHQC